MTDTVNSETLVPVDQIPPFRLVPYCFLEVERNMKTSHGMPDAARPYLRMEGGLHRFKRLPEPPSDLTPGQIRDIGLGKMPCPICSGHHRVWALCQGEVTGYKAYCRFNCVCLGHRWFYSHWRDTDIVPINYRGIRLSNLHELTKTFLSGFPRHGPVKVGQLIQFLRDNPDSNYLLCGESAAGKSTCITALYHHALSREASEIVECDKSSPCVWRIGSRTLSAQFRNWEIKEKDEGEGEVKAPLVTAKKVRSVAKSGWVPRLFLEEIDKINLTSDFQRDMFFDLLEAMEPNNGQIVVTSNLSRDELQKSLGEKNGKPILRRICGKPNGVPIDFTKGEIIDSREKKVAVAVGGSSKSVVSTPLPTASKVEPVKAVKVEPPPIPAEPPAVIALSETDTHTDTKPLPPKNRRVPAVERKNYTIRKTPK